MNIEKIIKTDAQLPSERRLILSLIYTANWMNDRISDSLKAFDISIPQFNVLRILRGQKGKPANLSTVQDRMLSKMSNTTRLVDKLIVKELAQRVTCEQNRRKVEISITSNGLALLDKVDPVIAALEIELLKNLKSEEIEQLTQLLETLRK
ncbi:MarR family transcriptional regulator [Gillisia sp. M10.2A]|uniref:MarR family transcriptional regulator n=1 Tax=Gillisia lutea TaxID=2909668 RepID=A0ABS9ELU6_9FLAO|nr:MarR family transcriptional regulator [Gillisia lutea]MCF4102468.1 MarR family transcriptional regulator [Gillisia lutea]